MKSDADGLLDFCKDLERYAKAVQETENKKEMLENAADMVIEQFNANYDSYFDHPTGDLKENVVKEYGVDNEDEVAIGWTNDGFSGRIIERGYDHIGPNHKWIIRRHLETSFHEKEKQITDYMTETVKGWFD